MRSTKFRFASAPLAIVSVLVGAQLLGQGVPEGAENVPLTYNSVMWAASNYEADENDGATRHKTFARRSDGSTVEVILERATDGALSETRRIVDLESGRKVFLDSAVNSITTTYLSTSQIDSLRNRRAPCGGPPVDSLLGYGVTRTTSVLPLSHTGPARLEILSAPELGCIDMERRAIIALENGAEGTLTLDRVVNVELGEPDESLFVVPAGYTEMSPSERLVARAASEAEKDLIVNDWFVQQADRGYYRLQRLEE